MVKKRVAYSVDTKNKAVEMKLQGYTTKQVMQELNIKNCEILFKNFNFPLIFFEKVVSYNHRNAVVYDFTFKC